MPLTGQSISRTANFLPANATSPSYSWSVTNGSIPGSSVSSTVTFNFTSTGTQTLSLAMTNACSTVNSSESFTVCDPITGLAISGATSVLQNSTGTYTASVSGGNPLSYTWFFSGTGVFIISGQGTNAVLMQFGSVGNANLRVDVTDCDGNVYQAFYTIDQTLTGCIALTSCSIS